MQTSQHNSATDKRFLPFLTWVQQKDARDMWIKGVLVVFVWRWASSTAVTLPKQSQIETLLLLDPQRISVTCFLALDPKTENSVDEIEIRKGQTKKLS